MPRGLNSHVSMCIDSGVRLMKSKIRLGSWRNVTGSGLSAWATKSTTYTAANGDRLLADTTSAPFTITLPASPSAGDEVEIVDKLGTFATNNLTIARNGSWIETAAENLVCDSAKALVRLIFVGGSTGWRVVITP